MAERRTTIEEAAVAWREARLNACAAPLGNPEVWTVLGAAETALSVAVKALEAERAKPPGPPPTGLEPTDAQVVAFGDDFFGDLTQWGYSERQRNGIADGVRRGLRAAMAVGAVGPSPGPDLEAIYQAGFDAAPVEGIFRTDVDLIRMRADIARLTGGAS